MKRFDESHSVILSLSEPWWEMKSLFLFFLYNLEWNLAEKERERMKETGREGETEDGRKKEITKVTQRVVYFNLHEKTTQRIVKLQKFRSSFWLCLKFPELTNVKEKCFLSLIFWISPLLILSLSPNFCITGPEFYFVEHELYDMPILIILSQETNWGETCRKLTFHSNWLPNSTSKNSNNPKKIYLFVI